MCKHLPITLIKRKNKSYTLSGMYGKPLREYNIGCVFFFSFVIAEKRLINQEKSVSSRADSGEREKERNKNETNKKDPVLIGESASSYVHAVETLFPSFKFLSLFFFAAWFLLLLIFFFKVYIIVHSVCVLYVVFINSRLSLTSVHIAHSQIP